MFEYTGETDPVRGLTNGQLVMSFRSTEFNDDSARDNEATNKLEISETGWAIGQIADMEAWYASLQTSGSIPEGQSITVTGYSLGGHLATAFTLLHQSEGRIAATYTFNGAGVGEVKPGQTLAGVIDQFNTLRGDAASQFTDATVQAEYQLLRNSIQAGVTPTTADIERLRGLLRENLVDLDEGILLLKATERVRSVRDEIERLTHVTDATAPALIQVPTAQVAAAALDYQIAVLVAAQSTEPYHTGAGAGGSDAVFGRNQRPALPNFYDIYGEAPPSAVANSQWHYGAATPVWIEDQPLARGFVVWNSVAQSALYNGAKLLVDDYSRNDFGDTHSLVLIVDSLSVQDLLVRLDPTVSQGTLNTILESASNAVASTGLGSQGRAAGDTLERVLDAMRWLVAGDTLSQAGPGTAWTPANMAGGTWANIDDRNFFHNRLAALQADAAVQAMAEHVRIHAPRSIELDTLAQSDFSAIASLITLSPLLLQATDEQGRAALESLWQSSGWSAHYEAWLGDRASVLAGEPAENFSHQWMADRQVLLDTVLQRNQHDNQSTNVGDASLPLDRVYDLRYQDSQTAEQRALVAWNPANNAAGDALSRRPHQFITFGSESADDIAGTDNLLGDHLYGGAGGDTLSGLGGDDHLEGNEGADTLNGGDGTDALYGGADDDRLNGGEDTDTLYGGTGNDILDGGQGNDTLAGGAGLDVYNVDADSGRDTVIDSDGRGRIWLAGREITGTGELQSDTTDTAVWVNDSDATHPLTYRLDRHTNELSISGYGSTVLVRDYESGDLGITIPGAAPAPPPVAATNSFDLASPFQGVYNWPVSPIDPGLIGVDPDGTPHDYTYEPIHLRNAATAYDGLDERWPNSIPAALTGLAHIYNPFISGLQAADLIEGGPGEAVHRVALWGAGGNDRLFAGTETTLQAAAAAGESDTASGTGWLWLDGGEGDDLIAGGAGNDLLTGGAGGDKVSGGAGSDVIAADFGGVPARFFNHPGFGSIDDPGTSLYLPWFTTPRSLGEVPALPTFLVAVARQYGTTTSSGRAEQVTTYVPLRIDPMATLDLSGLYAIERADLPALDNEVVEDRRTYAELNGAGWNGYGTPNSPTGGNDTVYAGSGNDVVNAGGGDDTVFAGTGNDVVAGYDGQDHIAGGAGDDVLHGDYASSSGDLPTTETIDVLGAQIVVRHTLDGSRHGNDELDGGAGNDIVLGNGADDNIRGGDGDDRLYGDEDRSMGQYAGDDAIDGGAGDDLIVGGGGADQLAGGEGADQLLGDLSDDGVLYSGRDTLDGGAGSDEMAGGGNDDVLIGGLGDDLLWGDATELEGANTTSYGSDTLDGGEGNDTLQGDGGADVLLGGAGNDTLWGDDDESRLGLAHHGADRLDGGAGDDYLDGQGGDDQIDGGEGSDELRGGVGNDNLQGGAGRDALLGGDGDDVLDGGSGGDALYGAAGNDVLVSDGDDALAGGDGDDTYRITLQGVQTVDGVATLAATRINDTQGDNTLVIEGASIDTSQLRMFSQGGTTFLAIGGAGLVAVSPADLATLSIEDSSGQRHALAGVTGVDAEGRVQTGVWQAGVGVRDTRDSALAQQIQGTEWADHVEGGQATDEVEAGAGNDLLLGHEGADTLAGDAGSDVLVGGAGNDTLYGGTRDQEDSERDTFVFNLGDGTDQIIGGAASSAAARDIIEFGSGVRFEDLRVSDLLARNNDTRTQLMIEYGTAGDRIVLSPGGEGAIESIRFADGSSVPITALLEQLPPRTTDTTLRGGTEADDALQGSADNESLRGYGGNDRLDGRGGRDLLVGGAGRNTYRFDADSGSDFILPTAGETGRLEFAGVDAATALAWLDGEDLIITYGAGGFVRLAGYALLPGLATQWQVQFGDQSAVALGDFLQASPDPEAKTLAERQQQFMERQQWQLAATSQRFDTINYNGGLVPAQVQQAERWVQAGQAYEFGSYLEAVDREVLQTVVYQTPIYAVQGTWLSQGRGPATFVPAEDWIGSIPAGNTAVFRDAPSGGVAVFNGQGAINGYLVPRGSAGLRSGNATHIVGWEVNETTQTTLIASDIAMQTRLNGTEGDDVVLPAANNSNYPVLFRGSVEAGGGNDVITLGSGQNGRNPGTLSREEDWGRVALSSYSTPVSQYYERGLGAWIDAGTGDDRVSGTDGHDFIIGGAGSDWLDGQAGADTYFVSAQGADIDHIADVAQFDWQTAPDGFYFRDYGGDLDHPNRDVVEFDASVALADLSYRWNPVSSEGYQYQTLELFHQGREFLQIDYRPGRPIDRQVSWAGVELFRFSDGTMLDADTLLAQLPRLPDVDPYAAQTIDLSTLDSDISLASLSYAWVTAVDRPEVISLRLFSDHQPLVDLDFDAAVPESQRFAALNGIFRFELASGEFLFLQELLASAPVEPLPDDEDPYAAQTIDLVPLDADVSLASLSYAWIAPADRPDVATLRLFSDHQALLDLDYDAAVPENQRFAALNGIFRFELASGEFLFLQQLLNNAEVEPMSEAEPVMAEMAADAAVLLTGLSAAAPAAEPSQFLRGSVFGYLLPQQAEQFTLAGAAIGGTVSALDNLLFGNRVANALAGRGGNDAHAAQAGSDTPESGGTAIAESAPTHDSLSWRLRSLAQPGARPWAGETGLVPLDAWTALQAALQLTTPREAGLPALSEASLANDHLAVVALAAGERRPTWLHEQPMQMLR